MTKSSKSIKPLSPSARKVLSYMYGGERARYYFPIGMGKPYWRVKGGSGTDVRVLLSRGFVEEVREGAASWDSKVFADITPEGRAYHEANPEAAPETWYKVEEYGEARIVEVQIIGHTESRVTLASGTTEHRTSQRYAYYPTRDEAIDAIIANLTQTVKSSEARLAADKAALAKALKQYKRG